MADLAPELANLPWTRATTQAWTTRPIRTFVIAFIQVYVTTRSWVQHPPDGPGWSVLERFSDQGLDSQVERFGPYQPTTDAPFYQRSGDRQLVLRVIRARDGRVLEVGITFQQGNETSKQDIARVLVEAGNALDAEHRRNP